MFLRKTWCSFQFYDRDLYEIVFKGLKTVLIYTGIRKSTFRIII